MLLHSICSLDLLLPFPPLSHSILLTTQGASCLTRRRVILDPSLPFRGGHWRATLFSSPAALVVRRSDRSPNQVTCPCQGLINNLKPIVGRQLSVRHPPGRANLSNL
eukprot:419808-Hanusia_phi.AAC.1